MNPVSNTAYYCCGIRMLDAKANPSVCHDDYAERFMDASGLEIFEPFKSETMPNISNITRCRLIDDCVAKELANHPAVTIITIGAGFDTRPYRLKGGHWLEIDEPQIIDHKNKKLPVEECQNSLKRVTIDFANEPLTEKLADISTSAHTVFVVEGVFMYLKPAAIMATIDAIQQLFPNHVLYCDLMTKRFFAKFAQSVHTKLVASGGRFTERPEQPSLIFKQHDYTELARTPMFQRAGELGILWQRARIPKIFSWLMLNFFAKDLNGYAVYQFQYEQDIQ